MFSHDAAHLSLNTLMIQSFRIDRSGQSVQTMIRLLLEEQSDKGLQCLFLDLHLLVCTVCHAYLSKKFSTCIIMAQADQHLSFSPLDRTISLVLKSQI